jgi:nitroreductase
LDNDVDAIEAINLRRSVRDYLPKSVGQQLIEAIIQDAAQAPWSPISAPEPWVFNVICGATRIQAYGKRALQYARDNRPSGDGYNWTEIPDFSVFHNPPALIIISGLTSNRLALEECTRAGQNLTISAVARGLATCWLGAPMLWLSDPEVRTELKIPVGFMPFSVFALGYPATIPKRPSLNDTRINWEIDKTS